MRQKQNNLSVPLPVSNSESISNLSVPFPVSNSESISFLPAASAAAGLELTFREQEEVSNN